jgi:EAL domain-containing protein (putative c-di-GMP-specific phosphodiesterase class I)
VRLAPGAAERLIIEITETSALVDIEATCAAVAAMKSLGIRVAMDDFGAGHTSFKNLRRLGFDLIKIDGAFIQNLARSPDDRFFVRTLLDLARHLNIATVAEWVEEAETAQLLAEWRVDYAQGNFFGEAQLASAAAASAAA